MQRSAVAVASQASSGAASEDDEGGAGASSQGGALPISLNARGRTVHPEDLRAEKRFMRVAQRLLAAGASPVEPDVDGVTPLMMAARFGLALVFTTLLQGGDAQAALRTRDAWGNSALHWACAFKQAHVLLVAQQCLGGRLQGCVDDEGQWGNHRQQTLRGVWGAGMAIAPRCTEARVTLRRSPTKSKRLGVSAPL